MLENLKQRLLNGWSLIRFIRLALAVILIIQALTNYELLFALLGSVLLFQAVFNYGCCGANGCDTNVTKNKSEPFNPNQDTITYTEVK